jgi:phage repressor protein C with HTH and peptisase S24 domain
METLGERVAAERRARRWTQAELAERVTRAGFKIGQAGIAQIERRGDTSPKSIVQLAAALEVAIPWLQSGRGSKEAGASAAGAGLPHQRALPVETLSGPADVPIWASAEAGEDGAIVITPDPVDYVRRPRHLQSVKDPYGFVIVGHSMSPALEDGDTVIINPVLRPRPGADCVFIQDRPDGSMLALVKRLMRQTADTWKVRQFEPRRDFDLSRKKWTRVMVISDIKRGGL